MAKRDSGNYFILLVGLVFALFLNEVLSPQLIVVFGLVYNPDALTATLLFVFGLLVVVDWLIFYKILYKKTSMTWFFLGATVVSIIYSAIDLYQISLLYTSNSTITSYSFPAVYVFRLFRAFFLSSVFGITSYWYEFRKKKKREVFWRYTLRGLMGTFKG